LNNVSYKIVKYEAFLLSRYVFIFNFWRSKVISSGDFILGPTIQMPIHSINVS